MYMSQTRRRALEQEKLREVGESLGILVSEEAPRGTQKRKAPEKNMKNFQFPVYAHLKRELAFHHGRVNKYIVMHDTEVDKERGESLRMHANVDLQSRRSGYPVDEIKCGLGRAISEFLANHGDEWELYKHFPNNNGLTVLKKNGQHSVQ
jgi:hypothetical protein